ncbi:MAG: ABC transporter ATP-binding protein [Clostridiales bacterium]|nr:ABC transporter ATP-binding protein [Clostridiales bacterium]
MKSKNILTDFKRTFSLFGSHKSKYLLIIILCAVSSTLMSIGIANAIRFMIDFLVNGHNENISKIIFWTIFACVMGIGIQPFFIFKQNKRKEMIIRDIRINSFNALQELPIAYFEKKHSGETFTVINRAVDTSAEAIDHLTNIINNAVAVAVIAPYAISLDIRFGLIALGIGTVSALYNALVRNKMRMRSRKIFQKYDDVSEIIAESVMGFTVVKMFGLKQHLFDRQNMYLEELHKDQLNYTKTSALIFGVNAFMGWTNGAILHALGCWFALTGTMGIGVLAGAITIGRRITWSIIQFGETITRLQNAFTGVDLLYEMFNEKKEPERYLVEGEKTRNALQMDNIEFGYSKEAKVIHDVSIRAEKGTIVALVGDSGGGKSTLVKLLMGLYQIDSGKMSIHGDAMKEYSLEKLRGEMAYVPQDAYIFNGTIEENIIYGNADATDDDIITAAKKANAHEFILEQPNGYDTLVGERGIKLSGGQRQRIAISRAILKNAPILLLDEATSSLDSESEHLVQQALDTLMQDKTSVVVAHRLSTIEHANMIYYIKDGRVIEEGTHSELLEKSAHYAELYYREFAS